MMHSRFFPIGVLLGSLSLGACDDPRTGPLGDRDRDDATRAEYVREMVFVVADTDTAAVLDFRTRDAGARVHRTARGWVQHGGGWTPLYDLTWEGTGMRRAWRLVPHGPIRLRVGLDDEIEAIVVRDEDRVVAALEVRDFIAEWMPFGTAQLVLRQASLALGDAPVEGWLVDARFGVAPGPVDAAEPDGVEPPAAVEATAARAQDGLDGPVRTADPASDAMDGRASVSRTTPVRSLRAVLVSGDVVLVLGDTDGGLAAWIWSDEGEVVLPVVAITAAPGNGGSWLIEADAGTTLSGRLESVGEPAAPLAPRSVRGTVDFGDREMEVHGVLRPPDSGE